MINKKPTIKIIRNAMVYSNYEEVGTIKNFMYKVYGWMTFGLLVTMASSIAIYFNNLISINTIQRYFWPILIAQLLIAIILSIFVLRMNFIAAFLMFTFYSFLMGVSASCIFSLYKIESIVYIFGITACMFLVMAIYGYFTKADLTKIGNILIMGLFGIIIASLINLFFVNDATSYAISFLAVLIFTGLIAVDVQKIKQIAQIGTSYHINENNLALIGAFTLYLDFINLFLNLLNLFGKRES